MRCVASALEQEFVCSQDSEDATLFPTAKVPSMILRTPFGGTSRTGSQPSSPSHRNLGALQPRVNAHCFGQSLVSGSGSIEKTKASRRPKCRKLNIMWPSRFVPCLSKCERTAWSIRTVETWQRAYESRFDRQVYSSGVYIVWSTTPGCPQDSCCTSAD